jgi:hypothetical protein
MIYSIEEDARLDEDIGPVMPGKADLLLETPCYSQV